MPGDRYPLLPQLILLCVGAYFFSLPYFNRAGASPLERPAPVSAEPAPANTNPAREPTARLQPRSESETGGHEAILRAEVTDGGVRWRLDDSASADLEGLSVLLAELARAKPKARVVIVQAPDVEWGEMPRVLALCHRHGLEPVLQTPMPEREP